MERGWIFNKPMWWDLQRCCSRWFPREQRSARTNQRPSCWQGCPTVHWRPLILPTIHDTYDHRLSLSPRIWLIINPAYGYSCSARTPNNSVLQTLASGVASAIRAVYGTTFEYGPICSTIYQVAGGSVDYVQDVTKAKHVFTIELRDTGTNGFVLPASQILPSGIETFAGFRHLLVNMA